MLYSDRDNSKNDCHPHADQSFAASRKPLVCALLYGAILFTNGLIFNLAFGGDWLEVTLSLLGATGLAFGFFWLLNEFESGPGYWLTLLGGSAALLFLF